MRVFFHSKKRTIWSGPERPRTQAQLPVPPVAEPAEKDGCGIEEKKRKKCMTEPKSNHASYLTRSRSKQSNLETGRVSQEAAAKAISFRDKICCLRISRDIFSQPVRWSRIPRINLGKFVLRCWGQQFSEAALCSVQLSTKSLKAASCLWHRCNLRSTPKRDFWDGLGCST